MTARWAITMDCANPQELARFWEQALGYVAPPPPDGHPTWDDWLAARGVPEDEWGDGAFLVDPDGVLPTMSLMRVPEPRTVKNRMHLDLQITGGRDVSQSRRHVLMTAEVARLVTLGARVVEEAFEPDGRLDHVWMADPEGNDFCLV